MEEKVRYCDSLILYFYYDSAKIIESLSSIGSPLEKKRLLPQNIEFAPKRDIDGTVIFYLPKYYESNPKDAKIFLGKNYAVTIESSLNIDPRQPPMLTGCRSAREYLSLLSGMAKYLKDNGFSFLVSAKKRHLGNQVIASFDPDIDKDIFVEDGLEQQLLDALK